MSSLRRSRSHSISSTGSLSSTPTIVFESDEEDGNNYDHGEVLVWDDDGNGSNARTDKQVKLLCHNDGTIPARPFRIPAHISAATSVPSKCGRSTYFGTSPTRKMSALSPNKTPIITNKSKSVSLFDQEGGSVSISPSFLLSCDAELRDLSFSFERNKQNELSDTNNTVKVRMHQTKGANEEQNDSLVTNEGMPKTGTANAGTAIIINPNTSSLQLISQSYQECIANNEPRPYSLVTQVIFKSSSVMANNKDKPPMYLSTFEIKSLNKDRESSAEGDARQLRIIEVQVMLRLHLFVLCKRYCLDDEHCDITNEQKKKHRSKKAKHKKSPSRRKVFLRQLSSILQPASFLLPAKMTFSNFLERTIAQQFYEKCPSIVEAIYGRFELALPSGDMYANSQKSPEGNIGDDHSTTRINSADKRTIKKGHEESTAKDSLPNTEISGNVLLDRSSTLPRNVLRRSSTISKSHQAVPQMNKAILRRSLTAPARSSALLETPTRNTRVEATRKRKNSAISSSDKSLFLAKNNSIITNNHPSHKNPFLAAGGKSQFRLGHFTTKLSNMHNLFREVKLPQKQRKRNVPRSTNLNNRTPLSKTARDAKSPSSKPFRGSAVTAVELSPQPSTRMPHVVTETPEKVKTLRRYSSLTVTETPEKVNDSSRSRDSSSFSSSRRLVKDDTPPRRPRLDSFSSIITGTPEKKNQHVASIVMEAALAAAKKKRRRLI